MKNLVERPPQTSDAELRLQIVEAARDGRLHVRYQLPETLKAELRFADGSVGAVKNVSYGGLGVELAGYTPKSTPPYEENVDFVALGRAITATVTVVRVALGEEKKLFLGLAFCHHTPDVLHYLRFLIDGLRFGSTINPVPPSIRKEAYQSPEWHCFRGEGPCDLLVRTKANKTANALLTFPSQGGYAELSLTDGRLSTGEGMMGSGGDHRLGTQMQTSAQLNQETLRKAAFILASLPQPAHDCGRALLDAVLARLS